MLQHVRDMASTVCERATFVRINADQISAYAVTLPFPAETLPTPDPRDHFIGSPEATIAFVLTLDSVNFGSGYFPHLRKPEGMSGYFAIASALRTHFLTRGPLSAVDLIDLRPADCARIFKQDMDDAVRAELMGLFSRGLNDLGLLVRDTFGGIFSNVVAAGGASAEHLVAILADMPLFKDIATYHNLSVPFYKRAQITVADLAMRLPSSHLGHFRDLDRLTIFADNAVPNVLRVDGLLSYESSLSQRIDSGTLIAPGSEEEVEIRASAVHLGELIVASLAKAGRPVTAMSLDSLLWNRGQQPRYKASPRHRTRTVFY